jgi:hypothetical protein
VGRIFNPPSGVYFQSGQWGGFSIRRVGWIFDPASGVDFQSAITSTCIKSFECGLKIRTTGSQ